MSRIRPELARQILTPNAVWAPGRTSCLFGDRCRAIDRRYVVVAGETASSNWTNLTANTQTRRARTELRIHVGALVPTRVSCNSHINKSVFPLVPDSVALSLPRSIARSTQKTSSNHAKRERRVNVLRTKRKTSSALQECTWRLVGVGWLSTSSRVQV